MLKFITVCSVILGLTYGAGELSEGNEFSGESGNSESESSNESNDESSESESTTTRTNYYLSSIGNFKFAYAIDQCSPTSIPPASNYIKPTCSGPRTLLLESYSSSDCSDDNYLTSVEYSAANATFECNGENTYLELAFGIESCDYTFYSAVGACISSGNSSQSAIGCSSDNSATLRSYAGSSCVGTPVSTINFNDTCSYKFSLSSSRIYATAGACSSITTTTTSGSDTTTTSGGSSSTAATTTTSPDTTTASSDANIITLKNLVGVLIMVVCIMVFQL